MKLEVKQLLEDQPSRYELIKKIGEIADISDIKAYLVGGFVRDLLIARKSKDIDIVVVGDGLIFADEVSKALNAFPVVKFKEFGTAMIHLETMELEIVSARKEVYLSHSRNPKVKFTDLDEDLKRRDFTINTMALSINGDTFGEFIDPFNGLKDLDKGLIITPLDPKETFFEDPLRMLRAIRFASQLGFSIDENTFLAIKTYADRINIISKERIRDEFFKILMSSKPSFGINLLLESTLLEFLFPEILVLRGIESQGGFKHKDVYLHTLKVLDNVAKANGDINLRLAALYHDIAKPRTKRFIEGTGWTFHGHEELGARMFERYARKLRLSTRDIKTIEKLIRLHLRPIAVAKEKVTDSAIRRLIVEAGENLDDLMLLCRADITSKNKDRVQRYLSNFELVEERIGKVEEKDALRAFQSPFDGKEIMKMFNLEPGPYVGKIKHHIEEAILEGEIENTHDAADKYIEKNKEKLIDLYLRKH
ncbi:MAG: tRNA nucleotidyltransferase [Candidatus Neomarinimicrobiota bacterium]|nr:MAG: tRNA nucleotidyltransferase [Candidatus Neomarinimicrobiota bacterium]